MNGDSGIPENYVSRVKDLLDEFFASEQKSRESQSSHSDKKISTLLPQIQDNFNRINDRSQKLLLLNYINKNFENTTSTNEINAVLSIFQQAIEPLPQLKINDEIRLVKGIEDLMHLSNDFNYGDLTEDVKQEMIQGWFNEYQDVMTSDNLALLDPSLTFDMSVYLIKHEKYFDEQIYSKLIEILPEEVKTLYKNLKEFDPTEFSRIYSNHPQKNLAFASLINSKEFELWRIIDSGLLNKEELLLLGPHLKYLNLTKFQDEDYIISLLRNCHNLNELKVESNDKFKEIPDLPKLQVLSCFRCLNLKSISSNLSKLKYLSTMHCNALKNIPSNMPNLQNLNCSHCLNLENIPSNLPNLKALSCINCTLLKSLPSNIPKLFLLDCSECKALQSLPSSIPSLEHLNCNNCTNLQSISSNLPNLKELYCKDCKALQSISSNLPNLIKLSCKDCKALQSISSNLPNLIKLKCRNNNSLQALPSNMPRIRSIDYQDCPLIQELPQLPQAVVLTSNASNLKHTKMVVDSDEIKSNPLKYLVQLGVILLNSKHFPSIYYEHQGAISPAIDAGGVRRDFVTNLFQHLFTNSSNTAVRTLTLDLGANEVWPTWSQENDQGSQVEKGLRTIGALFAKCFPADSIFKTGLIFSDNFFEAVKFFAINQNPTDDELVQGWEIIYGPLSNDISKEKLFEEYVKDNLRLKGIRLIADQLREDLSTNAAEVINKDTDEIKSMWDIFCNLTSEEIKDRIQGKISADLLLNLIDFNWWNSHERRSINLVDNQFDTANPFVKTADYVKRWIIENKEDRKNLEKFIKAITGNNTLGSQRILIYMVEEPQTSYPRTSTCAWKMSLPNSYPTYEHFVEKLTALLETNDFGRA